MSINRGIFPGTFTMGNVVCGFLAILSAFEGNVITACWLIILAAFLDVLDGKIARLSGGSSQFGVELDSLADFLSFGVAPAVVVYAVHVNQLGKWGWLISAVYIMAASYRLARFNLLAATDEKKDFVGLPVPMAAVPLVAYIIFSHEIWGDVRYGQLLVSMIVLLSVLMVSQVTYDAMPDNFHTPTNRVKLIVAIVAGAAILFRPRLLLFPFCAAYILWGMARDFYRLFYRRVSGNADQRNVRRKKGRNKPNGSEE
ncbi:MAG TPA: CDP-diacylglycerol--serine O-phosphatidyltransferase [candidate division Zixibacteria bacterium]|nr:CDP-diacylglycerol--serine O-phosphatidyltransferase [candidate division Zixibacteria bacterium]